MKYINYEVQFESFTERHYIKTFAKKYKNAWDSKVKVLLVYHKNNLNGNNETVSWKNLIFLYQKKFLKDRLVKRNDTTGFALV